MGLIRAYVSKLPQLQAEEALRAVHVSALGVGRLKTSVARAALRDLSRAAAGPLRRGKAVPASPAALADMGIGYAEVRS